MTTSKPHARAIHSITRRDENDLKSVLEDYYGSANAIALVNAMNAIHDEIGEHEWQRSRLFLFKAFGIGDLYGIDEDLLKILEDAHDSNDAPSPDSVRKVAFSRAKEQLLSGSTFFFDTDKMTKSEYAVLVPEIIKQRKEEISAFCKSADFDIYKFASTYYGFTFLTHIENDDRTGENLEKFLDEVGLSDIQIDFPESFQFNPADVEFSNCSERIAKLLRLILQLSGDNTTKRALAAKELGDCVDVRAEPFLRTATRDEYPYVRHQAIIALRKTRNPHSVNILAEALGDSDQAVSEEAMAGIISIGESAISTLVRVVNIDHFIDSKELKRKARKVQPEKLEAVKHRITLESHTQKKMALRALAGIGGDTARVELEKIAEKKDAISKCARDALETMAISQRR